MANNVCMSGGALGADVTWGNLALMYDHSVIHWGFAGMSSIADESLIFRLSINDLVLADQFIHNANLSLKRKFPTSSEYVNNLIRRNWYQINQSNSLYAISNITGPNPGDISGGTAWAVQMYCDKFLMEISSMYILDKTSNYWFTYRNKWEQINRPPTPSGIWAGIGSREISSNNIDEMIKLFQ